MTNLKQLDRLVLKIVRLKDVYSEYEVTSYVLSGIVVFNNQFSSF